MNPAIRRPLALLMVLVDLVAVSARGSSQSGSLPGDDPLPVSAVTLFSSGVGHFRHDGRIDGDAEVTLAFDERDIDDLLKSLVLQDLDGGVVEAVNYPSRDPLDRILGSFSLNIADNPSLADLLVRARGEAVRVDLPPVLEGTILGIEYRSGADDGAMVSVLNLATADGLRQVVLTDVTALKFLNPRVQADLESALAVIAAHRQEDRRLVTLRFSGRGTRRVSVSYVREVPVWKTSYRLVVSDNGGAQLQGWAMVENTGETDWADVTLGLATGQPISFVMDLYTPLYVPRPRVSPDVGLAVAPQVYERERSLAKAAEAPSAMASRGASRDEEAAEALYWDDYAGGAAPSAAPMDLTQGVSAAAAAVGESLYLLDRPVSVPRREAALLPIIGARIPAERLSVFDRDVLAGHPLKALRITNDTGVRLPAGPATVFDGALYAGDARISALTPDEERLLSYAVDVDTRVEVVAGSVPEEVVGLKVVRGALEVTNKLISTTEYIADRPGGKEVRLLILHPRRPDWTLTGTPEPVSETPENLHYEITVRGEAALKVVEERIQSQTFALNTMRDDRIAYYLSRRVIDAPTRGILERIVALKAALAAREADRRAVETQIAVIHTEQDRIRRNMGSVQSGSDLYRRYVGMLDAQEDELLLLADRLDAATAAESAARKALEEYIGGI